MTEMNETARTVLPGAAPRALRTARLIRGREGSVVDSLVRVLAAASVVVTAMHIALPQSVLVGYLAAAALAPLWAVSVRRYRFGPLVIGLGLLAAAAGIWLQVAGSGTRSVNPANALPNSVLLIGTVLSIGMLLWARTVLKPSSVAFWFGVGLLITVSSSSALFSANPWKFGFYLPVAVTTLALARMAKRWWLEVLVLLALTGMSALTDSRSAFGLLLLAAILVIAQIPALRAGHKGSALLVFLGLIIISTVVWVVGQAAILGGYLGQATQARSLAQVQASGSLLLGGRPELAATLALMKENPWGFGIGIQPGWQDIAAAKAGMTAIGYDPDNNYVDTYMFGGHFELHSVFGDLWAQAGVVGLLFVAVVVVALLWGLSRRIADGTASGIAIFVGASAIWLILFGPWVSSAAYMMLAIALVAVPRGRRQSTRHSTTVVEGPANRVEVGRSPALSSSASSAAAEPAG